MCCFQIMYTGKLISNVWRLFFDEQLSMVLTKLEATHEKLIHLNVIRPKKIKKKWLFITGIIVHFIANNAKLIKWIILDYFENELSVNDMVINNNQHLNLFYRYINTLYTCTYFRSYFPLFVYFWLSDAFRNYCF